ncbi:hypothetical protein H5T53_04095 [Candidatus Bipolaricaulota bacterium]|nr:hypothetical protein [Candidatus Bipolaricaulota bacterium]
MVEPTLPVLPLTSALRGHLAPLLESVLAAFRDQTGVDLLPVDADGVAEEPAHVLLVLTGGTEAQALAFAGRARGPLLLLSHGAHNSLAAALETAARLRADGRKAHLVHLGAEAKEALPVWAQAVGLARKLRGQRVGLVGDPSPWLVASSPDPALLREKLGIEVVLLPLEAVLERLPPEVADLPIGEGVEIGEEARAMGARVHAALRTLAEEQGLTALSIACFGLLPHRMTACWALSRLSDAGIPGGCEGDLPALLALMAAQALTGGPGFLANPADLDLRRERLILAHCTVPLGLTESHRLRTHFESGLGLAVEGSLRPGPYTLVRFGGARLEHGFFVEGSVLPEPVGREDLCRTQVLFKMPKGALQRLLHEPLGNHHVLIPGHHRPVLSTFHELFLAA